MYMEMMYMEMMYMEMMYKPIEFQRKKLVIVCILFFSFVI
jgi:hypothetical protein